MENLIGRKVIGFKFKGTETIGYYTDMDNCLGEIGTIKKQHNIDVRVEFENGKAIYYPLDQIKEHLVDEVPIKTYERWVIVKASELKELREFKESIKKLL